MKKIAKWCIRDYYRFIILLVLLILNVYILTTTIIINTRYSNYRPQPYKDSMGFVYHANIALPNEELKNIIDENFDFGYIYIEANLSNKNYDGRAFPQFGIVVISDKINGYDYITTLAHELCHIKYFTANETYTEYMAFVELYESESIILQSVAKQMIFEHCTLRLYAGTEYDIASYICKYLRRNRC